LKTAETPDGLLFFDRHSGQNVLLDELRGEFGPDWKRPLYVALAITNRCNRQCRWCYAGSGPGSSVGSYWTREKVLGLARALDDYGVLGLAFGGGEPFTYPRFAELCRDIWDSTELDVGVTTNGDLVTYDDMEVLRGHFGELRVSVWSAAEIGKAERLLNRGIPIGINTILFRGGFRLVEQIVKEGVNRGIEDFLFLSCKLAGRADYSMVPTAEDTSQLAALIRSYPGVRFETDAATAIILRASGLDFAQPWIEEGAGKRFVMITHDGFVKPDSFSSVKVRLNGLEFREAYVDAQAQSRTLSDRMVENLG